MTSSGDRHQDETELRIFACDLIRIAGILLRLPQVALTTAQLLLQRVYHTNEYTFDKYPLDITSMAALFLAAKIEECPKRLRDIIDVFTHVIKTKLQPREIVLSHQEHERVREEVITAERRLLKALGFNLLSYYPHKILVCFFHAIVNHLYKNVSSERERDNKIVLQRAWNYCNDSLRSDIFIRFSNEVVVCACIELACEDTAMPFPTSTKGSSWFALFSDEQKVLDCMRVIRDLYECKPTEPHKMRRHIYLASSCRSTR